MQEEWTCNTHDYYELSIQSVKELLLTLKQDNSIKMHKRYELAILNSKNLPHLLRFLGLYKCLRVIK